VVESHGGLPCQHKNNKDAGEEVSRESGEQSHVGGIAASAGIRFQDQVAAFHMVRLLAGKYAHPPAGLSNCKIVKIWPHAPVPVDDVVLATSDGGTVYVQAKSTLRWSLRSNSELAKCLRAFVRTYLMSLSCANGEVPPSSPLQRPLDPTRDRLVIAIAADSPAHAEHVINKIAEAATDSTHRSLLQSVQRNKKLAGEYDQLVSFIQNEVAAADTPDCPRQLAPKQLQKLISCMRVERYDFRDTGVDRTRALDLLRQQILADPCDAEQAWSVLVQTAQGLAAEGLEVDLAALRERLRNKVSLDTAPDYRKDADALRKRSQRECSLIEDAIPCGDEGAITIERGIVEEVLTSVRDGHVFVHGEPGAGKSWVTKQVAQRWPAAADGHASGECILLRAEAFPVESVQQARQGLALAHDFCEVLGAWKPGANLLIIDGLDAARDETRARAIRDTIELVVRQTSWRVLATVRTFDMQHSTVWRRLLGTAIQNRPLEVPQLTQAELDSGLTQVPSVRAAVEQGTDELRELVRNPFNLDLLARITVALKEGGDTFDDLAGIRTQVELLNEYWKHRVCRGSNANAREAFVLAAADRVLASGQLTVPRHAVQIMGSEADDLLHDGVLVHVDRSGDVVRFFHNAFLDFACAKALRTQARDGRLIALLSDAAKTLFVRPSIRLLLAYLLCFSEDEFWSLFRAMSSDRLSAVWNVLPARVLVESRISREQLDPLVRWLDEDAGGLGGDAVRFVLQALEQRKAVNPVEDDAWLLLCGDLMPRLKWPFVNAYLAYLESWTDEAASLEEDSVRRLNECAHAVFRVARQQGWNVGRLTARAVRVIARTAASALPESRDVLMAVANARDCYECCELAREIQAVIAADASLAAELMITLFSHRETSDDKVIVSDSWVLGMYQSSRDAWYFGVWHSLQEAFPGFLDAAPIEAVRCLVRVIEHRVSAERQERHARWKQAWDATQPECPMPSEWSQDTPEEVVTISSSGRTFRYGEDQSHIWYDNHESSPVLDERDKLLGHFERWLSSAENDAGKRSVLPSVFDVLYEHSSLAVVWNRCLRATVSAPEALAPHTFPLLSAPEILEAYDSRSHAAAALGTAFALYEPAEREAIEGAILALPEMGDNEQQREWLERARDRYISRIPFNAMTLLKTRQIATKLADAGGLPYEENDASFVRIGSHHSSEDELRRLDGIDTTTATYQRLKPLVEPVGMFIGQVRGDSPPAVDVCTAVHPALLALQKALDEEIQHGVEHGQIEWAMNPLVDAAMSVVRQRELAPDDSVYAWALDLLLLASADPSPEVNPEREASFESGRGFGSGIRGTAASGLLRVAARADLGADLRGRVEDAIWRLARDPVSSVRLYVALGIGGLYEARPHLTWELAARLAAEDPSPRVLSYMLNASGWLVHRDARTLSRLAGQALDRFPESGQESALRQQAFIVLAVAAIFYSEPAARARLEMLLGEPITDASPLPSIVHGLRDLLTYESDDSPDGGASIRANAVSFYERVARHASRQFTDMVREYGLMGPIPDDVAKHAKAAGEVLNAIVLSLYFAMDTERQAKNTKAELTDEQRRRLFVEARRLIEVLADVRHPTVCDHLVNMLACMVDLEPRAVVELLARSLNTEDGRNPIHYESITLDRVVKIGEALLADHRLLLQEAEVSAAFIGALDGFVHTGLPEAHRLVQLFEDVAR